MSCVSHAFASVYCCLVVTCWERADLLAFVGDVYCIFVTFPFGILGHVWYLIDSFTDHCCLSDCDANIQYLAIRMMKLIIDVLYCFYLKYKNLFYDTLSIFQNCYLVKNFGFLAIPIHIEAVPE